MTRALLVVWLLVLSLPARAQDDALARGLAARDAGDHTAALAAFGDAWDLTAAPIARARMAIEALALGRFALAETYANEALAFAQDADAASLSAELAAVHDEAAAHLGSLEIRCAPGCAITVDGASAGTTPLPHLVRIEVGMHALHAELAGSRPADASADVTAGGVTRIALAPEWIDTRPILARDPEGAQIAGWSLIGAAAAALIIASVSLGVELDRDAYLRSDACTPMSTSDTRETTCPGPASTRGTYTDVARAMFLTAAVLGVTGLVVFLTAPSAPTRPSVACMPALGIVCQGTF